MKIFILRNFQVLPAVMIAALFFIAVAGLLFYPTLAQTKNIDTQTLLKGKVIAIDPGHGASPKYNSPNNL